MKHPHNIDEILKEIYQVDPSLKHKEDKLRQLISDLLTIKPETPFTESFKQELKNHLIAAINEQRILHEEDHQRHRQDMFYQVKFRLGGVATLSIFVFALFYYQQTKERNNLATQTTITPQIQQPEIFSAKLAAKPEPKQATKPIAKPTQNPATIQNNQTTITERSALMKFATAPETANTANNQRTMLTKSNEITTNAGSESLMDTVGMSNTTYSDDSMIKITQTMLTDHNIDLSNYGNPIIKKGIPSAEYTLIIFPFLVDNQSVTDENGNTKGIRVNIQVSNQHIEWIKENGILLYNGTTETRLR